MRRDSEQERPEKPAMHLLGQLIGYPYFALAHGLRWSGARNVPRRGPAIIAANHQSFYDPVMITLAANRWVTYIGLEQFFGYPVLGTLMRACGCLPVSEHPRVPGAYIGLARALRRGRVVGIFPEGGRSPDGLPEPPRPGVGALALSSGAPVIPVTILGAHEAWTPGRALPRSAPIRVAFGEPMRFGRDRAVPRSGTARREEVSFEIMLRVCEGFAALGRPDVARAARAKLLGRRGTRGEPGWPPARASG